MKQNLAQSFQKIVDSTFVNIDGILVQRGINPKNGEEGLMWGNQWHANEEEVRAAMKYAAKAIQLSIVNQNGEVVDLPKFYTDKYKQGKSAWDEYKKDQE